MGYITQYQNEIGMAFGICGLTFVVLFAFIFKQYFRFHDHVQMTYCYYLVLRPTITSFGSHLSYSWAQFIPNYLTSCNSGDMVCHAGFGLSFTICLIGAILILLLLVSMAKCRRPELKFEPIYCVMKGLFRWTYFPLAGISHFYLISALNTGDSTNLISSAVIVGYTIVFPIGQLIVYKIIQQENDLIWTKWIQFFSYFRLYGVAIIFAFSQAVGNEISKHFIYGVLAVYAIIYLWKNNFTYKIVQRILFALGQALGIVIFSFYLFDPQDLLKYDIDFFALAAILILDAIYYIIRIVSLVKYGNVSIDKINPEQTNQMQPQRKRDVVEVVNIDDDFKLKKKNKYDESDESVNLQNSRDSLVNSVKKGNTRRKK